MALSIVGGSDPPNEMIEHELKSAAARLIEMTSRVFLVIVLNDILHRTCFITLDREPMFKTFTTSLS